MTTLIKENIRSASPTNSSAVIDVDNWAARVSLDIIGKAGFGSDFHSLSQPEDTLNTLYRDAFVPNKFTPIFFVLSLLTHPTLIIHLPFDQSRRTRRGVKAVTVWIKDFLAKRQDASSEKSDNGGSRLIHQDIISAASKHSIIFLALSSTAVTSGPGPLSEVLTCYSGKQSFQY